MILRRLDNWPSMNWRDPFDELERMQREMGRLNERLSRGLFREPRAGVFPLMNVTEDVNSYYVRAELPGMKANEIDISVTGDSLSISGERKIPAEDEAAKYHRREREAGKFNRIVNLPGQIDTEKVEAKCVDGILTVILPKAAASKPKQISVKSA